MTSSNVLDMLSKYKMVYLKPDIGTYGSGVMKVEMEKKGARLHYSYQKGTRRHVFKSYGDFYCDLLKHIKYRRYLVQKGIRLLHYEQRCFDLRVMVQKTENQGWQTTGILGRVAQSGKVVTNYHSGGTLKKIDALLSPYLNSADKDKLIHRLSRLGAEVAKQLNPQFPGLKAVGLDIGIGKELHPWILEVNFRPDPYIFRKVGDYKAFRKIIGCVKARRK